MLRRRAADRLREHLKTFPVVLIAGPRQSGKTTLARSVLPDWRYFDLERTRDRDLIASDVEGFLETNVKVILDEAQRLPELFPALRSAVDRSRSKAGQYVVTGSARPTLRNMAGESLAGRIGTVELSPFLAEELAGRSHWLAERWFWGGYPPLYRLRSTQKRAWLEAYIDSFLNTDIPALGLRVSALRLKKLWTMLAHLHGGLLNSSELGQALGVSHHTVLDHLDILENSFMIRRLAPYHANIGKRLVKSPKIYLRDSGILHSLLGLGSPRELESHPKRGASWEGFVIEELIGRTRLRRPGTGCYFWATHGGGEVDLLIDAGLKRYPVEIKASHSIDGISLKSLRQCMKDLGLPRGFVVYKGGEDLEIPGGIKALSWSHLVASKVPWL